LSSFPIEGTISAKPFGNVISGGLSGSLEAPNAGTLRGSAGRLAETLGGDSTDSPENSAIAELSTLISSLGSLSAQAQTLPLSPPTLPGAQQPPSYQPQATDYMQFSADAD
jgi:hypothetical protein